MTEDERLKQIMRQFFDVSNSCSLEISEQLGMAQLQINQIHYLKLIDANANLTCSQLSEILGITKPSVTEIVNKLIKNGCINRVRSMEDGRIYYIDLTEKGKSIARSRSLSEGKITERILTRLSPEEIETLISLIRKVVS